MTIKNLLSTISARLTTLFGYLVDFYKHILSFRIQDRQNNQFNVRSASDGRLKVRAVEMLANGIIPLENWTQVFANPNLNEFPNLQNKAFCVWFPTMIDYLQGHQEFNMIKKELVHRNINCEVVFELRDKMEDSFREVLALYTVEEQVFIRDRRLQQVHGRLQLYNHETYRIQVFDQDNNQIKKLTYSAQEYRDIMGKFYANMSLSLTGLRNRFISSDEFQKLSDLHQNHLTIKEHIQSLITKFGIAAATGDT